MRQMGYLAVFATLGWATLATANTDLAFAVRAVSSLSNETVTELPSSLSSVAVGGTYYLELWVTDCGATNTGITSAYVDLLFDDSRISVASIDHGTVLTTFPQGSVTQGRVDELGGSTLSSGVAVEPTWVRAAAVEVQAASAGLATTALTPGSTGCAAYGRGLVSWSSIDLSDTPSVLHSADCNSNGTPDSEDIAGGNSEDCNDNDIPDECDIASGFSQDVDENGTPDECEPGAAIPAASDGGLAAMTLLVLAAGTWTLRRRVVLSPSG